MKYHLSIRILHWLMALIIISMLTLGFYMAGLDREAPNKMFLYDLHKSFGVTIFLLVAIRISCRLLTKIPPLPNTMSKLIKISAHFVHYFLYLLMILMPLSGYLMSSFAGYPVAIFSITLPNFVEKNIPKAEFFHDSHTFLAYVIITLLVLHILAAIKHRFFDLKENNILPRII